MSAVTLEQLQVVLKAKTSPLQKEMDKAKVQVEQATNKINSSLETVNKKSSSVGKMLGKYLSFAVITYGLVKFGQSAIKLASDLQEVQNVVDVAFGDMSYKVEAFSKNALKNFGLSELSAKRTASTFMAMSVGMGISTDKASNMAIEMTGLSADMSSFYNISNDMAQTALSAIWTGETETLKRYGIVMTEVNLQQFAYKQGIDKNINAMTQAEKTTLRYMFLQDALRLAQGDFVRTSGSWANQIRILSETFKELSTIIGNGLIKVLAPVVQVINAVLSKLVVFAKAVSLVLGRLFGTGGSSSTKSAQNASSSLGGYNDTLKNTEKQAKKTAGALSFLDELNVVKQADSGGGSSDASTTGGDGYDIDFGNTNFDNADTSGIEAFADKLSKYFEPLKEISFGNITEALSKVAASLQSVGEPIFKFFDFLYFNILVPLAEWTIEDALPAFFNLLAGALNVVGAVLVVVEPLFEWLWTTFLEPLANFAGDMFIAFLETLTNLLNGVSDWVKQNKALVEAFVIVIGSIAVAWGLVNAAIAIWNVVAGIGAVVTGLLAGAFALLTSPITLVILAIAAVIAIVVLLIRHWDDVSKFAKVCWDNIVKIFSGAAKWFDDTIIKPVTNGFKSFANALIGFVEGFVNGAIGGINGLIKGLNSLINIKMPDWLGGKSFSLNLSEVRTVSFPRLYNGGIAYGDTLARVGDYAGSSVNPEVIAPLSKLQQYMGGSSEEELQLMREQNTLLRAILQKPVIEESSIGRTAKKFIDAENERTGGYVFG